VFGCAALLGLLFLRLTTTTQSTTPALVNVAVVVVTLGAVAFTLREVDFSSVHYRFQDLAKLRAKDPSLLGRQLAREAATDMYRDHWLRGVGAGGFRHLFPEYVKRRPEIYNEGRFFWEHAHNDWLEIPIELGLTGVLLVTAAVGWAGRTWWRWGGRRHPLALMIAFGLGQVLLHAFMDFPLQCPAILVTWWALVVMSLRWLELDGTGQV
jgi:O-antigen ligase